MRGLLVALLFILANCSSSKLVDNSAKNVLPKVSEDAKIVLQLNSNIPRTTFYVDGKEIVKGQRPIILIDNKPHTITASPEGYITKEEYIQPPYNNDNYLRFTFMIGEKLASNASSTVNNQAIKQTVEELEIPADIRFDIPVTEKINENAIAVVIGNKNYQNEIPNVDFAINDASIFKKYLVNSFGFKEGNIIYVEDGGKATFDAIFGNENDHKGQLFSYVKPEISDVIIFYSGHGSPDVNSKSAYLMPVDSNPNFVSFSGYSTDILYGNLQKLNAKSIAVFLDACFSGASGNGEMLVQNASPIGIQIKNTALTIDNSLIISASSGDQVSSWYPEKRHGLFTYFLLKGIKEEANLNDDDQLTVQELVNYLLDQNDGIPYYARRIHNRIQTPTILNNGYQSILIEYDR